MGSLRRRLERLRGRVPRPAPVRPPSTLDEIRDIEADIRRLEAEIRAEGGTVEPSPDEDLRGDLEAQEGADKRGGVEWRRPKHNYRGGHGRQVRA